MSVTATTEACPASWPQPQPYWLETDDGKCVPLILSDPSSNLVVFKLDTKLKAKGHALKMDLRPPTPTAMSAHRSPSREPSIQPYPPPKPLASAFVASKHDHTGSGLPRRQPFGSNLDAIMRNSYPDNPSAFPRSPTDPDRKEFCSYWIRHGECDYMQQGCRYKHEMPDLMTLQSIGFRHVPEWHKEKMRMRTMRRPDLHNLQSIVNQNNDDSASEDGSDGSNDTRTDAPHRLTISPSAAGVIVRSVPRSPAPSTIDLLSFDSETDSETDSTPSQTPTVPENTPETSSYSLPYPPTTNRQGRFVPAGESLPRMSTPPLLPSPPSPSFYRKEKPKSQALEKTVYTSPTRRSPIYKQYFKDAKPIKSQETLNYKPNSPLWPLRLHLELLPLCQL
ncbi:hypothetical protein E6O75_ATG08144 [Venturia nashicola]|uniref:C3H1-type domain-containing protein n=1 Tax=Venturia nashicola TaxID=86259 RepID=A0A4Z1NVD5_9PEZI|nr:hypothetical protein E6O75_ATG08144 [Venturia nashicola]